MGDRALLLKGAGILAGSASSKSESPPNLKAILESRLQAFHAETSTSTISSINSPTLEDAQLETALQSLHILERVHESLELDMAEVLGVKDMANLRRLASIVFQWGTEPLLARILDTVTFSPKDYTVLSSVLTRAVYILLPGGIQGPMSHSFVARDLSDKHSAQILKSAFALGWLPASQASPQKPVLDAIRPPVMKWLSLMSPASCISTLGAVLSAKPPAYTQRAIGSLLTRQLLRPGGVRGLLVATLGEEDEELDGGSELQKLEHIVKVVSAVPKGILEKEYFSNVGPAFLAILAPPSQSSPEHQKPPAGHRRAAAFVLAHMIDANARSAQRSVMHGILLSILHYPFLLGKSPPTMVLPTFDALAILQAFISNAPPSLTLTATVLSPIIPSLYLLLAAVERTKVSDPTLRETLRGLLLAWVRVAGREEAVDVVWNIVEPDETHSELINEWDWVVFGAEMQLTEVSKIHNEGLDLLTPQDSPDNIDPDENLYGLRPNPVHFARWLVSLDRSDVASDIMVRLLNGYRELKGAGGASALRTLLYVQIILHMQPQNDPDSQNRAMPNPEHTLAFVQHALEPPPRRKDAAEAATAGLAGLKIVSDEHEGDSDDEDSDDDHASASRVMDDEMIVTAIQLLLSVLEGHPRLSARTAPVLTDIFSLLEPLTRHPMEPIRPLAREARMVLTARLASTSATDSWTGGKAEEVSAATTYQKALKLLQDPILPVRAHGLLLLRELVSPTSSSSKNFSAPALERALVPAVLSIFLQSVQDDDSYMFLNAIQGLSAMVDGFGRDVLRGLVEVYTRGTEGAIGGAMTQQEVDVKLRVGEALGQIVRRCGDALGLYVDTLVPPLFHVLRLAHLPTTLRTSALSILAQCCDTSDLVMIPYAPDLSEAMIDLLQVETVAAKPAFKGREQSTRGQRISEGSEEKEQLSKREPDRPAMDTHPTASNSKLPPLRRAALHFLSLLIRSCTRRTYEQGADSLAFPMSLVHRSRTILQYITVTDEDPVVCVMARECLEAMESLRRAILGFP